MHELILHSFSFCLEYDHAIVMSVHLTLGDRWPIASLSRDQGLSASEIAHVIHCTSRTVYNILRLFLDTNDVIERNGRDRRDMLNTDETIALRRLFYRYRDETSMSITTRFFHRVGCSITSWTVRNYRWQWSFHRVHARSQPLISERHAQQQLHLCGQYARNSWRKVIFSDKKPLELDASGIVYWIPSNRPRPTLLQSQAQFRVVIFDAVWYNDRSKLVFVHGRTNTFTYARHL
ncbi:unnamed protein product [Rotaria sp. Silwood2]|nr:unnamed protein product [Rotaria sp. Silwood2]CAF2845174.1 unnamed protein product [Rotaria sp. Silwood2]CAF4183100.1 unnamed protein product [Rotaria sp. Silwood2]CAF4396690.1 unnamed protein product [Rotaria sp. Silwood2]